MGPEPPGQKQGALPCSRDHNPSSKELPNGAKHILERLSNFAQLVPQLPRQRSTPRTRRVASPRRPREAQLALNCLNTHGDTTPNAPRPSPATHLPSSVICVLTRDRATVRLATLPSRSAPEYNHSRRGARGRGVRLLAAASPGRGGSGRAGSAVPAAELLQVAGPPRAEAALVTRALAGGSAPSCGERAGPGGAQAGLGPESRADTGAIREWTIGDGGTAVEGAQSQRDIAFSLP